MKKTILFLLLLLSGITSVFSHRHPRAPFYPGFYIYPQYTIIYTNTRYIHRLGNIYLDNDLTLEKEDVEKIDLLFRLDSSFNKAENKIVYFSDNGRAKIEKAIGELLEKKDIPDRMPYFSLLKSYSLENENILKLNFSNPNECYRSNYYGEDYYIYNLIYSLTMPYNDAVKTQFNDLNDKKFKDELERYLYKHKKLRIAGMSVFFTGLGLFGALNIAGLITLANTANANQVPIAVPAVLFASGFGALTISIGAGIPLWVSSYAKKRVSIDFTK